MYQGLQVTSVSTEVSQSKYNEETKKLEERITHSTMTHDRRIKSTLITPYSRNDVKKGPPTPGSIITL